MNKAFLHFSTKIRQKNEENLYSTGFLKTPFLKFQLIPGTRKSDFGGTWSITNCSMALTKDVNMAKQNHISTPTTVVFEWLGFTFDAFDDLLLNAKMHEKFGKPKLKWGRIVWEYMWPLKAKSWISNEVCRSIILHQNCLEICFSCWAIAAVQKTSQNISRNWKCQN